MSVLAVQISHIASDVIAAAGSRLDDGMIYLMMVHAPLSRARLVRLYNAMQHGTADSDPSADIVRVRAFRLEPLDEPRQHGGGVLMVDGEMVDYGPIQARVLPSMARVMCLDKESAEINGL